MRGLVVETTGQLSLRRTTMSLSADTLNGLSERYCRKGTRRARMWKWVAWSSMLCRSTSSLPEIENVQIVLHLA